MRQTLRFLPQYLPNDLLAGLVKHVMDIIKIFGAGILVLLIAFSSGCINNPDTDANSSAGGLKSFKSASELKSFLSTHTASYGYRHSAFDLALGSPASGMQKLESGAPGASDYSQTNIQVQGVDEADIIKSDGKYLYILSGSKLVIMDAYPAADAKILSETDIQNPAGIFINRDSLVVFAQDGWEKTSILQYSIADRSSPVLEKNISVEGNYFDSRMAGSHVYALINKPAYYSYWEGGDASPPAIRVDGKQETTFPEIYYFDEPAYDFRFITILSLDLENKSIGPKSTIYLMGSAQEMYVSRENIYVTFQKASNFTPAIPLPGPVQMVFPGPDIEFLDETAIHRMAIENGEVAYQATGSVPGRILNQFSMDEHNGYFRIATTTGNDFRMAGAVSSGNNVYTLDLQLKTTGKLENLAPGEEIYSARFMGDRAYLVTFKKIDPLFVIDMKDPESPAVLGKLKIPGYSDYLHPYDENYLIGIGKETIESKQGDFAWYQGVKLSLFDVTDVNKPKEIAKYEIGDRGTDSNALYDHKAFLFSKDKNLLVIPVTLAEIDESQYPQGVQDWHYGDYTFQGAYVFGISPESGITLRGRVSHVKDNSTFRKSGYYYHNPEYDVLRSLYMGNTLYTISNGLVRMDSLDDLSYVNELDLPYQEPYYGYPAYLV